jgi:hypothetical protein
VARPLPYQIIPCLVTRINSSNFTFNARHSRLDVLNCKHHHKRHQRGNRRDFSDWSVITPTTPPA